MRILIIDDNEEITNSLSKYLALENFDVVTSNNGHNGLNLIKTGNYDKILLDLAMPEFSGMDLLEALNQLDKSKMEKIILFTATSMPTDQRKHLDSLGVNTCLKKPIKMLELVKILNA